jgi:hypothetical protein
MTMKQITQGACNRVPIWGALLIALVAFLSPIPAAAQGTDSALLRGIVMDASKSVVPGATVTMTNDATKVSQRATTDAMGRYIFNALPPASYTATVEMQGFKTLIQPNIVLMVGQQSDLDFTLAVGATTQTVEVTGAAPLVNTVSAALGTEVTNRYISEMPLMDRQIVNLSFLAPGVTTVTGKEGLRLQWTAQRHGGVSVGRCVG